MSAHDVYSARLEAAERAYTLNDARAARLANVRGIVFVLALGFLGLTAFKQLPAWGYAAATLSALLYVIAAVVHDRVLKVETQQRHIAELCRKSLARLEGGWHQFSERGDRFVDVAHLYTADLSIFGQGSLFQLLDESVTRSGENRLAEWLSQP